jgi:hypothetical protein
MVVERYYITLIVRTNNVPKIFLNTNTLVVFSSVFTYITYIYFMYSLIIAIAYRIENNFLSSQIKAAIKKINYAPHRRICSYYHWLLPMLHIEQSH